MSGLSKEWPPAGVSGDLRRRAEVVTERLAKASTATERTEAEAERDIVADEIEKAALDAIKSAPAKQLSEMFG